MLMKDKCNIAFYTSSRPIPTVGGIERATITTANSLKSIGHVVYSIYKRSSGLKNDVFEDSINNYLKEVKDYYSLDDLEV